MITLNSFTSALNDANGVMPSQPTTPFNIQIGDEKELVLTYEFDQSTDNWSFWFNPGLFLAGQSDFAQSPTKPTVAYQFAIAPSLSANTDTPASYNGPDTQKNHSLTYSVSVDRMTFTMTFDLF